MRNVQEIKRKRHEGAAAILPYGLLDESMI
jgi:hypothetical protein